MVAGSDKRKVMLVRLEMITRVVVTEITKAGIKFLEEQEWLKKAYCCV